MPGQPSPGPAQEYFIDAWQRSIIFLDVLRQRGNTFLERQKEKAPHVLEFETELIRNGRDLARPVNYGLVRIIPGPDMPPTDPGKRAFVVVDPRRAFGSPVIAGTGIRTEDVFLRFSAGEPLSELAEDYGLTRDQTEAAIRIEAQFLEPLAA